MDSILNELRSPGPCLIGSWILFCAALFVVGWQWVAVRRFRIIAFLAEADRNAVVTEWAVAKRKIMEYEAAPSSRGHCGVLYYPTSQLEDSKGERMSPSDMARKFAEEILKVGGIACLPRGIFTYETHPLPGRIECKAAPLNEVEKRVDRSLDIHESRMSRLEDGLKAQAEALVSVRADLEKHKGIYAKIIEFNSRRDATTTKILEGCADHALRLCKVEEMVGIVSPSPRWRDLATEVKAEGKNRTQCAHCGTTGRHKQGCPVLLDQIVGRARPASLREALDACPDYQPKAGRQP